MPTDPFQPWFDRLDDAPWPTRAAVWTAILLLMMGLWWLAGPPLARWANGIASGPDWRSTVFAVVAVLSCAFLGFVTAVLVVWVAAHALDAARPSRARSDLR